MCQVFCSGVGISGVPGIAQGLNCRRCACLQDEVLAEGHGSEASVARPSAGAAAAEATPLMMQLAADSDPRTTPPEAYMQVQQHVTAPCQHQAAFLFGMRFSHLKVLK
jgi:hypothetical protein